MVHNLHTRVINAPAHEVGALIDSLASKNDRLWPQSAWRAMRLDRPLALNASGGHGPVRYFVSGYDPGRWVEFTFTNPTGFLGHHTFTVIRSPENKTELQHELTMTLRGTAIFTWPLFFRPMHDALIEESLDLAERECGMAPRSPHRRSLWTKILRAPFYRRIKTK